MYNPGTYHHSEETKRKIRESNIEVAKHRKPISYWTGKKRDEETKRKISITKTGVSVKHGGQFRKGTTAWNKGIKLTDKQKEKCRRAAINSPNFMIGEKHWNWRGGIGRKHHERNWQYNEWRKNVFKRDNYTCRSCGDSGGYLNAHHIKSYTEYKHLRYDVNNGVTLCKQCHHDVHLGPRRR